MIRRLITLSVGLGLTALSAAPLASASTPHTAIGFDAPDAITSASGNVWVANSLANTVVAFSPVTGAAVHTVGGTSTGINHPAGLITAAGAVFAASPTGAITEINATSGAVSRVLRAASWHLKGASAFAYSSPNLWVVDSTANALTEFNATNGRLVRVVTNVAHHAVSLDDPVSAAISAGHLWVANAANNTVTEFNASNGAVIRVLSDTSYQFDHPNRVVITHNQVWVTNPDATQVTVINAVNGGLVTLINNSSYNGGYGFNEPGPMLAYGSVVYVASPPGGSPMVTQVQLGTYNANWMMCNTNYNFNFSNPQGLTVSGANLFVANEGNNTVTEMNASTGVLVTDFS